MARVQLQAVTKFFGETEVIPDLDLAIEDREFVVLVGPSGCGKTTTLRMIAGLEAASSGQILIGDREVTTLRPGLRNCAMVFQNYALYPHMTVRENITYGLRVRKTAPAEIDRLTTDTARILTFAPQAIEPLGAHMLLLGQLGDAPLVAQVDAHFPAEPNQPCQITCDMTKLHLFDAATGQAL